MENKQYSQMRLLTIRFLFLLILLGPFLEATVNDRRALHFYILVITLLLFLFLTSLRFASLGLRYSFLSFCAGLNLFYIVVLILYAIVNQGLDRSNFSFILVAIVLYIAPNIVGVDDEIQSINFENWIVKSLLAFFAIYTSACLISNELFLKISPPAGLVTPQLALGLYLAIKKRNLLLFILTLSTFLGIAKNHYQSSYILAPLCVIIILIGNRRMFVRKMTYIFLSAYATLVVFTNILTWMLTFSKTEGYDNVIIRVAFVEYGINFVQSHIVFGGALIKPVTILIKNAGVYTTLPLHSDALTWLIGTGSIGWLLYSLTTFGCINQGWKNSDSCLQNSLAAVALCNYVTGFFNSQYSTYAFLFTCFYTVVLSFNKSTSRVFIKSF